MLFSLLWLAGIVFIFYASLKYGVQNKWSIFDSMPDLPGLFLIALLLSGLVYGALRLCFPGHKSPYRSDASLEELHNKFRFFGFRQTGVMILITLAGGLAAYGLFHLGSLWFTSGSLSKGIYLIRADRFAKLLVALLGGAAVGFATSPGIFKRMLKADYPAYVDYQNRLTGLDNELTSKWLSFLLAVAFFVISYLFIDWYSAFGPAGIRQAPLFSTGIREHAYSEIEWIEKRESFVRPDGKNCNHQHFIIHFSDGEQWNSRNSGYETVDRNQELLEFIESKISAQTSAE